MHKVVVVKTPEWKLKTNIAKTDTFERRTKFLPDMDQKWQKKVRKLMII